MLSFAAYKNGTLADKVNLSGAYVVGTDDVPLRAEITLQDGVIHCKKRAAGPAGLAILWEVAGFGQILLETIRVQEREQPYILQVELARGRLMRINNKLEDWGLLEYEEAAHLNEQINHSRDLLIKALQAETWEEAAILGDESLSIAIQTSEALSLLHAEIFLERRKQTDGFHDQIFGCSIHLDKPSPSIQKNITKAFDFVTVPFVWKDIEPAEQTFNWKPMDNYVEFLVKHNIPVRGSTLLSFNEKFVPDWLYIWEHDFETIRDLAFEHIHRVIERYNKHIQIWNVITGIHANNCFTFNFEQLMELTRMSSALMKQLCPDGTAILELVFPWGEYYARNQRTIPPLLYADMAIQSGVNFDAFGLQLIFGHGADGMYVRDMFQISSMLDQFSKLSKPLHITAVQTPSDTIKTTSESLDPDAVVNGGTWHEPWSEKIQSQWLNDFFEIALSKPFIESVSWHTVADHAGDIIPSGGLLKVDYKPKKAYQRLIKIRSDLTLNQ